MATKKKEISSVKGLVVRSVEDGRGRQGYRFSSTPQFVDVQADELTDAEVEEILGDRYLMAVEVANAPKGASVAARKTEAGQPWTPGAMAIGNATLETATAEMVEEAKEGHLTTQHPSAPGGEPIRPGIHPSAVEENVKRLQGGEEGAAMAKEFSAKKGRGRPKGSKTKTAKTAKPTTGDRTSTAGAGTSEANKE